MVAISSISGVQAAAQSGLRQLALQQARRNAEQAEQTANALQAQAIDARLRASEAQETARIVSTQADQAQANAGQARQGLAAIRTVGQMATQLVEVVTQVAEKQQQSVEPVAAPSQTAEPAAPVINTQGQVTGTVINTTA